MGLDPGGIYGLQILLLTALSKITISLQFGLAKIRRKALLSWANFTKQKESLNYCLEAKKV